MSSKPARAATAALVALEELAMVVGPLVARPTAVAS
jgi:hypothetical protein